MITAERVRELLHYDPETGVFTWLVNRSRVRAGMRAGTRHATGYTYITLEGREYKAHRLAWLYVYSVHPTGQVDHINRVRSDDRIANLRDVPGAVNARNRTPSATSSVACNGVYFHRGMQRFQACIHHDGGLKHLGTFDNLFDAVAARRAAENRYWTDSSETANQ